MIAINIANMVSEIMGAKKGLSERQIEDARELVLKAHGEIQSRSMPGLAFMDLPDADTSALRAEAGRIREDSDNFLLLGIGGSALGPKAILEALSPLHNLKSKPRVFIYDNVDPCTLESTLSVLDLERTTVNVITKSGSTAETISSFMVLWDRLKGRGSDKIKAGRLIATTDPKAGPLRQIAAEHGLTTFSIGENIGGRYSVLSPVGLLLAEVIGASSDELLRGARDMRARCSEEDLWKNPAYLFGTLLYLMDKHHNRKTTVMLPYCDRLRVFGEWFCQIWAESLGKSGTGLTPYPSLGTTDQHSQLQLWMEGPEDKVVVLIKVTDHGPDVVIPEVFADKDIGYLGGKGLSELMAAEQESTELCLAKAGKPNMALEVPLVDAYSLGQLFYFFELATAFTGLLYGINPFDQPSVEVGKHFTYGMMGRKGFEEKKAEVQKAKERNARWRVV